MRNLRQVGHPRQKTVAAPVHGLDEAGMFGGIAKCLAEARDRSIQIVLEINEHTAVPEPPLQFLSGDYFARVLEQRGQYLKGLLPQLDPYATFAKLAGVQINFVGSEAAMPDMSLAPELPAQDHNLDDRCAYRGNCRVCVRLRGKGRVKN
ncbi:MAG TPA: hypothetical protein VK466_07145 [Terriglobales bacterium]|nr:hypothetical protein [Terriglobales bacterium]